MTFTITPLLTGVRNPDQGIMTYQQGYGKRIWLPIWSFLVRGDGRNVLVDTGLNEDEVVSPPEFEKETGLEAKTMTEALAEEGLSPGDVDTVILTHLHDDHCGASELFENAVFYVQKTELDFCRAPHPIDHRYDEFLIENVEFELLDGDAVIMPGVRVLFSPGHTPGCQTVVVDTSRGPAIITGFCCNKENFPERGPAVCPGVHTDAIAAYDSIQKIKEMGGVILPMHDPELKRIK
jgi:glyoxylase-like metal-dependent hydrolase (beta-lactamase superfamily II)